MLLASSQSPPCNIGVASHPPASIVHSTKPSPSLSISIAGNVDELQLLICPSHNSVAPGNTVSSASLQSLLSERYPAGCVQS